jgi:hypothetical protein
MTDVDVSAHSIGHTVKAENLLGRGTPIAPIYRLVASSLFTAIIFLILFSVSLLDLVSARVAPVRNATPVSD